MTNLSQSNFSTVTNFNFGAHAVRIVMRDGEPWFIASDVAKALEYRDAEVAARHLRVHQKGVHPTGVPGKTLTIINESGLYRLVLRSRKPSAEQFSDWVTGEVLPSIRKTGSYATMPKEPSVPTPDVHGLLLSGMSMPEVPLSEALQNAIDKKAFSMGHEAYELSRQHLRLRVAYECEQGRPRFIDHDHAINVISEGGLVDALARPYYKQLERVACYALTVKRVSAEFFDQMESVLDRKPALSK